jgi:hypothetical protein
MAGIYVCRVLFGESPFFPGFGSAAVATPRRAARHLYFPSPPVHLWVVIFRPGVPEDEVLLSESGYAE